MPIVNPPFPRRPLGIEADLYLGVAFGKLTFEWQRHFTRVESWRLSKGDNLVADRAFLISGGVVKLTRFAEDGIREVRPDDIDRYTSNLTLLVKLMTTWADEEGESFHLAPHGEWWLAQMTSRHHPLNLHTVSFMPTAQEAVAMCALLYARMLLEQRSYRNDSWGDSPYFNPGGVSVRYFAADDEPVTTPPPEPMNTSEIIEMLARQQGTAWTIGALDLSDEDDGGDT